MSPLLLLTIVAIGAIALSSSGTANGKSLGSGGAVGTNGLPKNVNLSDVVTTRADGTVKFTREAAVGIWRSMMSHAYATDPLVSGRVQVAPSPSGSPLPAGAAATDWALEENAKPGKALTILAPIYLAYDHKGARYLRALADTSIANKNVTKEVVYAILADPGEAKDIDAEANAPVTPPSVGTDVAGKAGGAIPSTGPGPILLTVPELIDYKLTTDDANLGPLAFATRAGFKASDGDGEKTIQAFLDVNPELERVKPTGAGWPPIGPQFQFTPLSLTGDPLGPTKSYVATARLDQVNKLPTFTEAGSGDPTEWTFPQWSGDRETIDGETVYKGLPPLMSGSSSGDVFAIPSVTHPTFGPSFYGVIPWVAGMFVKIPKDHPSLSL